MYTFGDNLRIARNRLALQQSDLAGLVGLQAAAISKYEKNASSPNVETLKKLCQALHVSSDWLLGLENESPKTSLADSLLERVSALPSDTKERLNGYLDALEES